MKFTPDIRPIEVTPEKRTIDKQVSNDQIVYQVKPFPGPAERCSKSAAT